MALSTIPRVGVTFLARMAQKGLLALIMLAVTAEPWSPASNISAPLGSNVTLWGPVPDKSICTIEDPNGLVCDYVDGKVRCRDGYFCDNGSVILTNVQKNHAGWYKVKCDGRIVCSLHLSVTDACILCVSDTKLIYGATGGSVQIPVYNPTRLQNGIIVCDFRKDEDSPDTPVMQCEIQISKCVFTDPYNPRCRFNFSSLTVTLGNLRNEDSGLYRCELLKDPYDTNPIVTVSYLTVVGSLSQQTTFLYGTEHGSVQFPDLYAAQSVFQFVRLSHGQIFCEHIMGGKVQCMTGFEGRVDSFNGSFLLKNLSKQDEGTYQSMKVTGSIGNAVTATFQLTVLDSRTITQNSSHRGTDISLKANVSGENAILIWTKDGKPLPGKCYLTDNNRTLVLPSAEAADAGKYTLTVENSYCKTSVSHDLLVTAPESPHKRHRFFLIPAIFPCAVFALIVYI